MISGYFAVPLIYRIVTAFILGIAAGILCSRLTTVCGEGVAECVTGVLAPFGTVLIAMLKMVVIPIIFFSLVTGAASLPLKQFGKLGLMVVVWYFLTSVFAAAFGTGLAYLMNPAMETDASLSGSLLSQAGNMKAGAAGGPSFLQFLNDLFMNPFQALAEVFDQPGPGLLVHPVWRTVSAYFVTLELLEEPMPDYVRYSFSFWEDGTASGGGLTEVAVETGTSGGGTGDSAAAAGGQTAVYTVRKGDTLWGIAGRYGVALTDLIAANPQIKNPNLIYPGDRVRIP